MYRLYLGKISALRAQALPPAIAAAAPSGVRRDAWLAGRALLCRACSPLPEIVYGEQGKPAFAPPATKWFNLSHSGDDIALLISDEGEVGCDIECIRPRPGARQLAANLFSPGELAELDAVPPARQLAAFWRIWTRKEALLKQRGGSVWQLADADSSQPGALFISHCRRDTFSLAVCTPTPLNILDIISETGEKV